MRTRTAALMLAAVFLGIAGVCRAQSFDQHFLDRTLRLDYTFSGNNHQQQIYLDEMRQSEGWFGRRVNMDSLLLQQRTDNRERYHGSGALPPFFQHPLPGVAIYRGGHQGEQILRERLPGAHAQADG